MALESLDALADGLGARLLAWVNFTARSGRMIPMNRMRGYAAISCAPGAMIPPSRAGADAERVNAHQDSEVSAGITLFKHLNPLAQWALRLLRRRDSYSHDTETTRATFGSDWQ